MDDALGSGTVAAAASARGPAAGLEYRLVFERARPDSDAGIQAEGEEAQAKSVPAWPKSDAGTQAEGEEAQTKRVPASWTFPD